MEAVLTLAFSPYFRIMSDPRGFGQQKTGKIVNNFMPPIVPNLAMSGLTKNEAEIVKNLHAAIIEQRLLSGTRLTEEELSDIFQVSRMRIRRVLLALAHTGMIELPPGRGAIVARPSAEQARDIFAARRLLEGQLLERPLVDPSKKNIKSLHELCKQEDEAALNEDLVMSIQLSGAFHVGLAKLYGNAVLAEMVTGLVSQTALIIAFYQTRIVTCCRSEDHKTILKALEKKEFQQASQKMREHLQSIENALTFDKTSAEHKNLRQILARS